MKKSSARPLPIAHLQRVISDALDIRAVLSQPIAKRVFRICADCRQPRHQIDHVERPVFSVGRPSTNFGPVQPFGKRSITMGQPGPFGGGRTSRERRSGWS
jgi:hypothetical protein